MVVQRGMRWCDWCGVMMHRAAGVVSCSARQSSLMPSGRLFPLLRLMLIVRSAC